MSTSNRDREEPSERILRPTARSNPFEDVLERFGAGARNALQLLREGRLGAPYRAPFDVAHGGEIYRLRHYHPENTDSEAPKALLVPPLMVTSEIYDMSPELSAVSYLASCGLDVWLVDYGSPREREDGLDRSLDDHVLAVDDAVERLQERFDEPVHLVGYSQGGIFCYQAAAYRRSESIESIVTFGSPVDIRRNLPVEVHEDLAARLLRLARSGLSDTLKNLEALPGSLTSRGFKLLNPGKELKHLVGFFGSLHDREELEQRLPTRRFLGGDGFVAWPGEALREFIDEVVVDNRMASGGFVVGNRSVSLADIDAPILYFHGARDELAHGEAVRAVEDAAAETETRGIEVASGHFGMVVGSTAMGRVWPTVQEWIRWQAGHVSSFEPEPEEEPPRGPSDQVSAPADTSGSEALYDVAAGLVDSLWSRLGDVSREVGDVVDTLRWQIPRLARIESLEDDRRVNIGRALAEQARAIPEETFFLWRGRAFSYEAADRRVDQLASALLEADVEPGDHVGVLMDNHPDFLTAVGAASRIGAVAVLINAGARGTSLEHALETGRVDFLVTDGSHAAEAADLFGTKRLAVGATDRAGRVPEGALDLEAIFEDDTADLPEDFDRNPGRVDDLAMLIFTSGTTGMPKAAKITNRRWALAALGTAASCELTPRDTIYCVLPLYHATGLLVAVGGALIGGARLALGEEFSAQRFWSEVRRYGATVVFYVGELCRYLVDTPEGPDEENHPVRLFVGNGMRPNVWRRLLDRFGPVDVLEFYGSTEGNVCLANLSGEKVGSVGRPLPGTDAIELVDFDAEAGSPVRNETGRVEPVSDDEPGLLLARISDDHPLAHFEGYLDREKTERKIVRDAFDAGDAWFNTGDVLRCDEEGDYWFVDRVGETFRWSGENVSTEQVAGVIRPLASVDAAVVYGVEVPRREGRAGMAAIVPAGDGEARAERFDAEGLGSAVEQHLFPAARPRFVRLVEHLETTESFKYVTERLKEEGASPSQIDDPVYVYRPERSTYEPLEPETWPPTWI